jgi:hypothetical protein
MCSSSFKTWFFWLQQWAVLNKIVNHIFKIQHLWTTLPRAFTLNEDCWYLYKVFPTTFELHLAYKRYAYHFYPISRICAIPSIFFYYKRSAVCWSYQLTWYGISVTIILSLPSTSNLMARITTLLLPVLKAF